MPYRNFDIGQWVTHAFYLGVAVLTGMLGFVFRQLDAKVRPVWWRTLLEGFGAAVVGLIYVQVCAILKLGPEWTTIVVALGGWMGAQASIRVLEDFVFKRLNIKKPSSESPPSGDSE